MGPGADKGKPWSLGTLLTREKSKRSHENSTGKMLKQQSLTKKEMAQTNLETQCQHSQPKYSWVNMLNASAEGTSLTCNTDKRPSRNVI